MKNVNFSFGESASDESQNRARDEILSLSGVRKVGRVLPEAKKPALKRLWWAEVDDEAAERVVDQLRAKPGIQLAELPAARRLIS